MDDGRQEREREEKATATTVVIMVNVMYVLAEPEVRRGHTAPQLEAPTSNLERERGFRAGIGWRQTQATTAAMQGPLLSLASPSSACLVAAAGFGPIAAVKSRFGASPGENESASSFYFFFALFYILGLFLSSSRECHPAA